MAVFMLDALMDRFLQAYCVPFLDAGAGIYQAPGLNWSARSMNS